MNSQEVYRDGFFSWHSNIYIWNDCKVYPEYKGNSKADKYISNHIKRTTVGLINE